MKKITIKFLLTFAFLGFCLPNVELEGEHLNYISESAISTYDLPYEA